MALKMNESGIAHCVCDRFQECRITMAMVDEMPKYCPFNGKKASWVEWTNDKKREGKE